MPRQRVVRSLSANELGKQLQSHIVMAVWGAQQEMLSGRWTRGPRKQAEEAGH